MAQPSNFVVPAQFRFRPSKVSWVARQDEIVGWWEKPEILKGDVWEHFPDNRPAPDGVLVRIDLPSSRMLSEHVIEKSRSIAELTPHCSYIVRILRSAIQTDVWRPYENRQNTPEIGGRSFDLFVGQYLNLPDPVSPEKWNDPVKNAWDMRDDYFDIEGNSKSLLRFLNKWGFWGHSFRPLLVEGAIVDLRTFVFPHQFWEQREEY